ncbi:hypothetical protein [Falsiporphyromonas endometrii]|uniref:Uncharacterized protein n=1 Tax=Falsiporphyromonas endometrii TaxID=1387297 RepID=A0ABV9K5F7_9PORP|nr:hypothetical protein [Porphyromonadaceae bacterium]
MKDKGVTDKALQDKIDNLQKHIKVLNKETETTKDLVKVISEKIEKAYTAIDELESILKKEKLEPDKKKAFSSALLEARDHLERGYEFTECAMDDLNDSCTMLKETGKSVKKISNA